MINPINFVEKSWKGPALNIVVKDNQRKIGQGEAKTTIIFHNPKLLKKLATSPSMTFGEGYMSGEIEIQGSLMDVLEGYYKSAEALSVHPQIKILDWIRNSHSEKTKEKQAIDNARHHYDIGNDFYKLWLDKSLAYTCAYFANENDSLETAQKQKFELVLRKARVQEGQSIIDIGCGWGGLIFHAVENYNVTATGVVAAKEQGSYILEEAKRRGVEDKVNIIIGDWREATGTYDRVISVGLFEHVGEAQYPEFFKLYKKLLKPDGVAFVHTIGHVSDQSDNPWIRKYIFPGGHLPTLKSLSSHASQQGFVVTDAENLWQHYAKTLNHWTKNFEKHIPEITEMFDEQFIRMWRLYLEGSEAAFRWGGTYLWQMVLIPSKNAKWPLNREVDTKSLIQG